MSLQNVMYMWEVELLSSRLEDVGTCKNVVLPTGGMAVPRLPGTVNSGAYNTIEVKVGAYNTVCGRAVVMYCSAGYGP